MNYGDLTQCEKCFSDNLQVVRYVISNGAVHYRYQCRDCGYVHITSIKKSTIPQNLEVPLLDENLRNCYYDNCKAKFENYYDVWDYDEYITSDKWYKIREQVFTLKGRKCMICGTQNNLVVHHLNYDNLGHEENNNYADVIPLCKDCHEKIHKFLDENEENYKTLKGDLEKLRNNYLFYFHEAINDKVYQYTKDLKWHSSIAIKIFLETLYGKYHCKNGIQPYFDSDKVLKKIKSEDN